MGTTTYGSSRCQTSTRKLALGRTYGWGRGASKKKLDAEACLPQCATQPWSVVYSWYLPGARGVEGKRTAPSFREYCAMIIPTLRVVPSFRRKEDQGELVNVLEVEYGSRPGFIEPGYTYAGLVEALDDLL